ncbi:MAG: hypothetical protein WBD66_05740, partial [Candidatus Acidiferrales bacterium]
IPRGGSAPAGGAATASATVTAAPALAPAGAVTLIAPVAAPARLITPPASSIAAEVVAAHFPLPFAPVASKAGAPTRETPSEAAAPPVVAPSAVANAEAIAAAIAVAEFVCENDVRGAATRGQKIYIGPKTIVTPSAREFGDTHDIFVVTNVVPPPGKRSRSEG